MMMRIIQRIKSTLWLRLVVFIFLGGIAGFSYYYFIGCHSGSCPITGNPYISTSYGALMGLLLSYDKRKKEEKQDV